MQAGDIHDWIICTTQARFFNRPKGTFHYEVKPQAWYGDNKSEIDACFQQTGLMDPVWPQLDTYDAAGIFGATKLGIQNRLSHFHKCCTDIQIQNMLYLLSGSRKIMKSETQPNVASDGDMTFLTAVANDSNEGDLLNLTEAVLFDYLYRDFLKQHNPENSTYLLISVLDKDKPTTMDTLRKMAGSLPADTNSVLFVSSAPFIRQQHADVKTVFSECMPNLKCIETCGSGTTNCAAVIGAIGAHLYGDYDNTKRLRSEAFFQAQSGRVKAQLGFNSSENSEFGSIWRSYYAWRFSLASEVEIENHAATQIQRLWRSKRSTT